ncbi:MAG: DNA cytosine methyltransferase [Duncaniella sp.]|nr:DNA cytosine methyltransferase [Duncaniella sp.]
MLRGCVYTISKAPEMKKTKIERLSEYIDCKKFQTEDGEMSLAEQMAFVTHYIYNRNTPFEANYIKGREIFNKILGRPSDTPVTDAECEEFLSGISDNFAAPVNSRFTFIDLFAGIGGFRLAMQEWGGRCVFSSEFNPNAQKTYCFNYGEVPFGDITSKKTKDIIPESFEVV